MAPSRPAGKLMQPCMKHKTVEWKETEAGRLRPEKKGERKKNHLDESLQGVECCVVRLPACRGALSLSPWCDSGK